MRSQNVQTAHAPDIDGDGRCGDQSCAETGDDPPNLVTDRLVAQLLEAKGDNRGCDGEGGRVDEDCATREASATFRSRL